MPRLEGTIGFIGAGNMGEAFVGALTGAGIFPPSAVRVNDVSRERLRHLEEAYGVTAAAGNVEVFREADIVVLAVKPQQMESVLSEIASHEAFAVPRRKILISIAAGVTLSRIEGILYTKLDPESRRRLPLVRVMPNTPALVLAGMSGMSANANAGEEDLLITRTILEAMGRVVVFDEASLDAVTGVSGSGPAYVFYLIESMTEGGVAAGLSREDAEALTLQTVKGAVALMEGRGESPDILRRKVTSPGGTTEAALNVLEGAEVKRTIIDAVVAATRRARALSKGE